MALTAKANSGAAMAGLVRTMYAEGQADYTFEPIVLASQDGAPVGRISDGDAAIFCCRRGEREVQLTEAFTDPGFAHFPQASLRDLDFVILTLYHDKFKDLPVAFAPSQVKDTLGETVSRAGLRQLRTAESEKFAHVTFFLNGGNNRSFTGEGDVCIPSPKGIAYEQVPELSLAQVAEEVRAGLQQHIDLVVVNFANGDVIGHTASAEAKVKCAEAVDQHLGEVLQVARAAGYVTFITADHGNLEELYTHDGSPHVAHTANLAPFIVVDPCASGPIALQAGSLVDIAPTVLAALDVAQPPAMTGMTLAPDHAWGGRRRVLLVILDGWGLGKADAGNPIHLAHTPVWDALLACAPSTALQASGEAVGLQAGKVGNSEAGHMNIGAGRVVLQDDVRLERAMQDGSFYTNPVLCRVIAGVRQRGAGLHLIGLLTEKSSHGSIDYPLAVARMAKEAGLQEVYLHMIFDGRSSEPGSAPALLEKVQQQLDAIGVGQIVTGIGRGIALDRSRNYARTAQAYDALVYGTGRKFTLAGEHD